RAARRHPADRRRRSPRAGRDRAEGHRQGRHQGTLRRDAQDGHQDHHEHGHAGREGGRQHGRPRFESDQADRGGGDRQADADHAWRADHVLDRQRYREVFRDHPRRVRDHLSGAQHAQRDASGHAAERDSLGGDLQCADHHLPDPAGTEGREVPRARRRGAAASQPAGLWPGRHRGAVPRHQVDRLAAGAGGVVMKRNPTSAVLTALLLVGASASARADDASGATTSANLALTSDYIFRGLTQTWGGPALQGGADYAGPDGFSTGIWGSSISERSYPGGAMELDLYASYGRSLDRDWS